MKHQRRIVRVLTATLVTGIVMYGIARLSTTSVRQHRDDAALLRLSWSARPERIEVCRTLSAEELAQRAEHMRQRVECSGRFATYQLRVEADGHSLADTVVHGAGLRNDRPIYLLTQFSMAPGERRIRIHFQRRETIDTSIDRERGQLRQEESEEDEKADTGTFAGRAQRERTERDRRALAAIPPLMVLDTTIAVTAGQVWLVTMDPDRRTLALLQRPR